MRQLLAYILFAMTLGAQGQVAARLDKNFSSDDSTALVTLAALPENVRPAVLEACQNPEVLIKAEALQKSTSQSFRELTDDYTKAEQKRLWDLARYPGLVNEMVSGGKKSKDELETISKKYPEEIRPTIRSYGRKHYEVLERINTLFLNSQSAFNKILASYPENTRQAYQKLTERPDVLHTLANNMHLAVTLGEMYRSNSQNTKLMLDSISAEHVKQNAKDLEEWKKGLESNPQARQELEQVAREFSAENEVKADEEDVDDVYKSPGDKDDADKPVVKQENQAPVINNYYMQPYPYWFGYPWWYDYPFWYPYPHWYHAGFYWGPGGMVFFGYPSPFFMHWYLYHPYHHYYYSHFTDYCIGFHHRNYGPRASRTGFNREIREWKRTNEAHLPKGYFNADPQRPQRIKELGKFEMDYHNSTKGVFGKNISRPEFLKNNPVHYPNISPVLKQPQINKPVKYPQQQNPVKFNMEKPRGITPRSGKPSGGFSKPATPKGMGGAARPRK